MRIEILNTGSELMLGRVLNTHQQWLCRQLTDLGYPVERQVAVDDSSEAIEQAARVKNGMPTRAEVLAMIRALHFQGIAYAGPVEWDAKGDNKAAVIFVNVVDGDRFREVGEITQDDLPADR